MSQGFQLFDCQGGCRKGQLGYGISLIFSIELLYYKVSITRPGRSRLLEFEKKYSTGCLIETFSKYPDQVV